MNRDLGFSPAIFGFGAGIFFIGYSIFQVPANLILEQIGARRWMFCILLVWGALSASNAFVRTPTQFYTVRLLLGVAEAGCYPGMLLYLTYWFPRRSLAQFGAMFAVANPMSAVIGAPLGGSILATMNGVAGVHGWQWLFVLEAMPAIILSVVTLRCLPDAPQSASWLTGDEKQIISRHVEGAPSRSKGGFGRALLDRRLIALGVANFAWQASAYGVAFFVPQIVHGMGFSIAATGFVVAAPAIAGAAAMILCGRSSTRRGERILHASLPWLFAALAYFAASRVHDDWIVLAALVLGAIGLYGAFGTFMSLPSSFLGRGEVAAGIGIFNTFGGVGGFVGPSLVGILRQTSGDYASGLAAVAVGFAITGFIVLAMRRSIEATPVAAAQSVAA